MLKSPLELYKKLLSEGIIDADSEQTMAVDFLQRLYDEIILENNKKSWKVWEKKIQPKGIYIYGGVGRGKSMLMDLFFDCLSDDISRSRVHFHAFMIDVHDYLHLKRKSGDFGSGVDGALPELAARIAKETRVLCFDEFHVTDITDAMILGRLFTALFDFGVIIVATSNWKPELLYENGLQRDLFLPFINLLRDKLEIVHLDSSIDFRAQCLKREGAYFYPLGKEATQAVDGVFNYLTDNILPEEDVLEVKGRKIIVSTTEGIARFTFFQLCENSHGVEDYLIIAQKYHTVFLENVPKMGEDHRNEVKRFIMFIDAMYENKTNLVISADALSNQLYVGDDYAFEFKRTISRLLEMQSEEYLEKK